MAGHANWIGGQIFLGRISIGSDFTSEAGARDRVVSSANSRIKAMFGGGMETTAQAVQEGRELRVIARAILRAGI